MDGQLFLVHWEPDEAAAMAEPLERAGWAVHIESGSAELACEGVMNCAPLAAIISLDRDPSRGCDLACVLMQHGAVSDTPIIFVGGMPEDVAEARRRVPGSVAVGVDELPWVAKRLTYKA